jgi:tetratricopeptide (TPR) repeat protein
MSDPEKTVFISYRRSTSKYLALLIFKELNQRGYDVFYDIETIDSGAFESIILNQIAARTHFMVLLAEGTLDRCSEPGDWLRQEIERAMDLERNIVPVLVEGFNFNTAQRHLTGKLYHLPRYNGLKLYYEYVDAAVDKLCSRYLKPPEFPVLIAPPSPIERTIVEQRIAYAIKQPVPTPEQLTAEEYFVRACKKDDEGDLEGAIADYSKAILLNPVFDVAYHNRGVAHKATGDFDCAIADYSLAIYLTSGNFIAYNCRGNARRAKGDLDGALADYTKAIHICPCYPNVYAHRGYAQVDKGIWKVQLPISLKR